MSIKMSEGKKGLNQATTAVAGALIGAAATAVAIVLSDEKNRKKAEKILKDIQMSGDKIIKDITQKARDLKDQADKQLSKTRGEVKRISAKKE